MTGHVHDFEAQWVCEGCGQREALPAGTVVAAEVAKVREEARAFLNRFTEPAFCRTPMHDSGVSLAHSILHLLGGEQ